MQPVSLTAQWTAAIRSIESERPDGALFHDDFARSLAQPQGFDLLERYRGAGVKEFVVIRTRYFDDASSVALAEQPDLRQVVIVAAGMDTRAFRLNWPNETRVFEVDHEALLTEKDRRLAAERAIPKTQRLIVSVDLASGWSDKLIEAGFSADRPTLWLVEGLLFFLTEEQARTVLTTCRQLSSVSSRLVVDMASASLLRSPFTQHFLSTLRHDGVPWRFGTDEPEAFLDDLGWVVRDIKEPGMAGAGDERWPYKTQPRHVQGVSRSWLVTAVAAT